MSRSISIWYADGGRNVNIDTGYRDLLGAQQASMQFWSLPILREFGLTRLTELGHTDPVSFYDREELEILEREILILESRQHEIDFYDGLQVRWVENLRYCLNLLLTTAPDDSDPRFMIG